MEYVLDGLHTWHMSCMYISLTFEQELQFDFVCLFIFCLFCWFSGKGKCWGPYYRHHLLRSVQLHPQPKNYNVYVVIAHVAQR